MINKNNGKIKQLIVTVLLEYTVVVNILLHCYSVLVKGNYS